MCKCYLSLSIIIIFVSISVPHYFCVSTPFFFVFHHLCTVMKKVISTLKWQESHPGPLGELFYLNFFVNCFSGEVESKRSLGVTESAILTHWPVFGKHLFSLLLLSLHHVFPLLLLFLLLLPNNVWLLVPFWKLGSPNLQLSPCSVFTFFHTLDQPLFHFFFHFTFLFFQVLPTSYHYNGPLFLLPNLYSSFFLFSSYCGKKACFCLFWSAKKIEQNDKSLGLKRAAN